MTSNANDIAAFQDGLLNLLCADISTEEMIKELRSNPAFKPFQERIQNWEPRMIETASLLVKKWGKRGDGRGEGL